MVSFLIALTVVVAIVVGGLMAFRRSSNLAMPSQDVIDRVKARERVLQEEERRERES